MNDAGSYTTYSPADYAGHLASDWAYRCAMSLLQHPVDDVIAELLAYMGAAADVDRAWMLEYRADMLRFRNTHEWCRGQVQPFVAELQDVPTTLMAWLHRFVAKGLAVAINDVRTLPRAARALQVEFLRQGNKSVLSVPVFQSSQLYGIIGFDTTVKQRVWTGAEINALYQCANLIGQARHAERRGPNRTGSYEASSPVIYLSMRGVVRGVQPHAIVGVRSAGNYSEVWLEDGSMVLDSRALGMWSTLLPEKLFFRIHRTAIANALHVIDIDRRHVDKWVIRMRSAPRTWPVSRSYRKGLRERLGI